MPAIPSPPLPPQITLQPFPNVYTFDPNSGGQIVITSDTPVNWSLVFQTPTSASQGGFLDQITTTSCRYNPPDPTYLGNKKMLGFVVASAINSSNLQRRFTISSL